MHYKFIIVHAFTTCVIHRIIMDCMSVSQTCFLDSFYSRSFHLKSMKSTFLYEIKCVYVSMCMVMRENRQENSNAEIQPKGSKHHTLNIIQYILGHCFGNKTCEVARKQLKGNLNVSFQSKIITNFRLRIYLMIKHLCQYVQ